MMRKALEVGKRLFREEKAAEVTELGIVLALIVALAILAGGWLAQGCGADMTVQKKEVIFVQPSEPGSAAVLSGASASSGDDIYQSPQTVGGPMAVPKQTSENGKYSIR